MAGFRDGSPGPRCCALGATGSLAIEPNGITPQDADAMIAGSAASDYSRGSGGPARDRDTLLPPSLAPTDRCRLLPGPGNDFHVAGAGAQVCDFSDGMPGAWREKNHV